MAIALRQKKLSGGWAVAERPDGEDPLYTLPHTAVRHLRRTGRAVNMLVDISERALRVLARHRTKAALYQFRDGLFRADSLSALRRGIDAIHRGWVVSASMLLAMSLA
jgi:hypothetical protein